MFLIIEYAMAQSKIVPEPKFCIKMASKTSCKTYCTQLSFFQPNVPFVYFEDQSFFRSNDNYTVLLFHLGSHDLLKLNISSLIIVVDLNNYIRKPFFLKRQLISSY